LYLIQGGLNLIAEEIVYMAKMEIHMEFCYGNFFAKRVSR